MLFSLVSLITIATANFDVIFPSPRGTDLPGQYTGPCGAGLDSPTVGIRSNIDFSNFKVKLGIEDVGALLILNAGIGASPVDFPFELNALISESELIEVPVDFSKIPGVKNGDNVTIQIIQIADDGVAHSCIDVTLSGI
jgi:hypothetical protein